MNNQIKKRIEELRKENKTFIVFHDRYLLEGEQIGLGRLGDSLEYFGNRFIDYGIEPPKIIEINGSIVCSNLEKLFEVEDE